MNIIFLFFIMIGSSFANDETNITNTQENTIITNQNEIAIDNFKETVSTNNNLELNNYSENNKLNTTINSNDMVKYYNDNYIFQAELKDVNGNILVNMPIFFTINGNNYNKVTDGNGIAQLKINLSPGKYTINTLFKENENYNLINVNNTITVLSLIKGEDIVKLYKNNTHYYASIINSDGSPIANKDITMNINGVFYTRTTNENGVVRLAINLFPSDYIITVMHPNFDLSFSNKITVLATIASNDIVKYYKDDTHFYASILNSDGSPIANRDITMNINGVFYTRTTNENGIVKLTINLYPNKYILTINHPTDELKISNEITVLKMKTEIISSNLTIVYKAVQNYSVTYQDINGNKLNNLGVYFKINNKITNTITDKNGIASVILDLTIGEYIITFGFDGNNEYSLISGNNHIKIVNTSNYLIANNINMIYDDNSSFTIKLTDLDNIPLVNKTISFIINDNKYSRITNDSGIVRISINLYPGTYTINYYYSDENSLDYNNGKNQIIVLKQVLDLKGNDLVMLPQDGSSFSVLLTKDGNYIENKNIRFSINGNNYTRVTNNLGIASLKINLNVGYYTISYYLEEDIIYYTNEGKNTILVNGTILTGSPKSIIPGESFNILLTDAYGNPLAGEDIKINLNGVEYWRITNNEGKVFIKINLGPDYYFMTYSYTGLKFQNSQGETLLKVLDLVEINSIIAVTSYLINHVANYFTLPTSINIDARDYSMAEFLYLISSATKNIYEGNFNKIILEDAANPYNPILSSNLWDISNIEYLFIAINIINYISNTGRAPDFMDSSRGAIGFDGLVYMYSRIIDSYAKTGNLPTSMHIRAVTFSIASPHLNNPNTISDLSPYLRATANCQVNNPLIQSIAKEITAGLNNNMAKALAIFYYANEEIDYDFYYNTRYGALGTLNNKVGNCVDGTHLFIALCRAAGLPARYVHGTCTFISGNVIGHAWAQVYVDGTWIVADTSSSKNTLGAINNWNKHVINGRSSSLNF